MGCDYYITKVLQIYYSETEIVEYELERERGYLNQTFTLLRIAVLGS